MLPWTLPETSTLPAVSSAWTFAAAPITRESSVVILPLNAQSITTVPWNRRSPSKVRFELRVELGAVEAAVPLAGRAARGARAPSGNGGYMLRDVGVDEPGTSSAIGGWTVTVGESPGSLSF